MSVPEKTHFPGPSAGVRVGLRVRIMGAFAALAVAPTLLLGGLAILNARRDVQEEVIHGHLALIRSVGRELNGTIQDTRRALSVSAAAWAQEPTAERSRRLLRVLRAEFAILDSVSILDRQGHHVEGDYLAATDELFMELANTYGGYVSEVMFSGNRRHVMMVVQARSRRGELMGFVAAVVNLSFVQQRLTDARLGRGAALLVVDGNGRKVAATGALPSLPWSADWRAANPALDRVLATHSEGYLEMTDNADVRWVAVYRNIVGMNEFRGVRWGVLLLQRTTDAYALAWRTTRDTLFVATIVLVLALAAGAWLSGRITLPLADLVQKTDTLAMENFETNFTPHAGSDEIGQLSQSFAAMVHRLRTSRDHLYALKDFSENLVRSIPVGVISVDRHGVIRTFNHAQEVLSEIDGEQAIGQRLDGLFAESDDGAPVLRQLDDVLGGGDPVDETLDDCQTPFNPRPTLRYRIRISPLRDRFGDVDGAVLLQEDLSERARLEVQLLRTEKLSSVGVLAAGVAHEINNPLTTILGYAKLLLESRTKDDPDYDALSLVADEALRVQEIVKHLLDFSRKESGIVARSAVQEVVERTLSLVSPDLRKRGVTVQRSYTADLPSVFVDPRRIEQVFVNLVTNAAHAMKAGGQLTVSTGIRDVEKHQIFIDFEDTGPGIAPALLQKIFDPFFTTKEPGEGTGLGLAISQRIIGDYGGDIEVTSVVGRGTVFRVWLPAVMEEVAS